jgi:hypothetical protein
MTRFPFLMSLGCGLLVAACSAEAPVTPLNNLELATQEARAVVFPGGCCFYDGRMVRTVVPPAANPREGRDNFYGFPSTAANGQKGVVAVAPGDQNYHGGQWAFYAVTWNVAPYLLTSEAAVLAAAGLGHVSVTRVPDNDFKCPIQP